MRPDIRPSLYLILLAMQEKDWGKLRDFSNSPDPSIRAASEEAARCLSEGSSNGTPVEPIPPKHELFSTLND